MAKKLQKIYNCDFWKEVKVLNNSKMQMPSSIEGITELENTAELWRRHYANVLTVLKDQFKI